MMPAESNSEKSVSYQKKDGHDHARPSFFWYDNDKDLKVCFLVTCVYFICSHSQIYFLAVLKWRCTGPVSFNLPYDIKASMLRNSFIFFTSCLRYLLYFVPVLLLHDMPRYVVAISLCTAVQ